jgi:arylsulfatase A-like enzyme
MSPRFRFLIPLLAFALGSLTARAAADHPNVLWLTSEDHGPQVGAYGDALARTPTFDALAARGMAYRRAWSNHPVCAPARTAIISGMYATSTGSVHMRSMVPMPAGARMFPEILREAGYYATNHVKEDYNLPKSDRTWDVSSARAHWKNRPADQPFFAVFNSNKSHESQMRLRPHAAITDPARVRVPAYHPDTSEVRQDWAQYYDQVSAADADAGLRLREVVEAGLAEETIVFYFADHGSGMPRSKRWPSNSGLQVPFVVYFPEKWRHLAPPEYTAGGWSDRLVSFVDLAPTMLSLAGVKPPAWMDGRAFAGPHATPAPAVMHGSRGRMDERNDLVFSVTDGRYVYLRNFQPHVSQAQRIAYQFETPTTRIWKERFDAGQTNEAQSIFWRVPKAPEELYDLQTDPDEVNNLAGSPTHQAILAQLREAQRADLSARRDVTFLPESDMHRRANGASPYDLSRDEDRYPFERIYAAADLASRRDPSALPALRSSLADTDPAVRYWAASGFLMRGGEAVRTAADLLRTGLQDESPAVRIVCAQSLAEHGGQADLAPSLAVLQELASPEKNGVFVAMAALAAIESLGSKADRLREFVRSLRTDAGSPDERYNNYVPRLVESIAGAPVRTQP